MALSNVIKSYLVGIGFKLDNNSLTEALNAVEAGKETLSNLTSQFTGNIAKSVGGIATFVASAVAATAKLVASVADADMATQTSAANLWMNVDAYRNLDTAVTTLGYSLDELGTIAKNSELTQQFQELYNLSVNTQAPEELESLLVKVRSITFEFKKMKVLITNGIRQVVYYFLKYMGTDLDNIKSKLSNFTQWLQENLSKIAEKIAKVIYLIYRFGVAIARVATAVAGMAKAVYSWFKEFPTVLKVFVAAVSAILLGLINPTTLVIAAIVSLLLIVEDFLVWKQGGRAQFGKIYKAAYSWAENVSNWIDDMINKIKRGINEVVEFFGFDAPFKIETDSTTDEEGNTRITYDDGTSEIYDSAGNLTGGGYNSSISGGGTEEDTGWWSWAKIIGKAAVRGVISPVHGVSSLIKDVSNNIKFEQTVNVMGDANTSSINGMSTAGKNLVNSLQTRALSN